MTHEKAFKLFAQERKWCAIKRPIFCDFNGVGLTIAACCITEENRKQNFKNKYSVREKFLFQAWNGSIPTLKV